MRGQFAQVWIDNAGLLNDTLALRVGVNPNIGSALRGFSLEGSRRFLFGLAASAKWARSCATRTSTRSTGCRPGYVPLQEFDRDAWVVGANYWPDPDIAVKVDYSIVGNQSSVISAPNSFNVGLGWWF